MDQEPQTTHGCVEPEYVGFDSGEIVYLRHFQRDRLAALSPLRVVRDLPDGVLLWGPTGNTLWTFDMPDGRGLTQTPLREWSTAQRVPVARTLDHSLLSWHRQGVITRSGGSSARMGSSAPGTRTWKRLRVRGAT
jgi:hypothetical protein